MLLAKTLQALSGAERFIVAATAPLADTNAGLHLAAQHALRERNDPHQADPLRAAANRLEKIKCPRWIPALLILMGIVSLPIIVSGALDYRKYKLANSILSNEISKCSD